MARKLEMDAETVEYLDGLLSGNDDLSDGAWRAFCLDKIKADARFSGVDPYEVWLAWVNAPIRTTTSGPGPSAE